MALRPLLRELLSDYNRPADLFDQHFGLGLCDDDINRLHSTLRAPFGNIYLRPWRALDAGHSGMSSLSTNKDEFRVNLDVQQFQPEELKVKVEDGYLVIDGKHEERSDEHGFISRQFTRRYKIPEDVDQEAIKSNLSSDGVLTLKAPKKEAPESKGREIPITRSSEPAVKSTEKKSAGKEKKSNEAMEQ